MDKKYLDNEDMRNYDLRIASLTQNDKNNEELNKIDKKINNINLEILENRN